MEATANSFLVELFVPACWKAFAPYTNLQDACNRMNPKEIADLVSKNMSQENFVNLGLWQFDRMTFGNVPGQYVEGIPYSVWANHKGHTFHLKALPLKDQINIRNAAKEKSFHVNWKARIYRYRGTI